MTPENRSAPEAHRGEASEAGANVCLAADSGSNITPLVGAQAGGGAAPKSLRFLIPEGATGSPARITASGNDQAPGEGTATVGELPVAIPAEDHRPPQFSDEELALRFAKRHAGDLRFVAKWNKWLSWTETHWQFDDTLAALDKAREICREAAAACDERKVAKMIASKATVYAVECLARADRRLAAAIDQWDADPWLLNTPSGVIDLRTGQSRPHRADDYMTKIAAVAPGGECSRFRAFLERIAGGDAELVAYLRRMFGYGLTGLTHEQALFFAHGTGANGKSVLLATVAGTLLFRSWSGWAQAAGEIAGTQRCFADKLESRGFVRHKRNVGQGFHGLRLKAEEPP